MKYLSVCSGIEAATVAWHPLGFTPAAFAEIEPFPSAVLAHHYPDVPNLGDMTRFREWPDDLAPDVLVGGTPCQSFSVAGLRKGLDDPRGNLALTFLAIADRYRPRWIVWENVPGVLSSGRGRDFGAFLGALGALGYGFAYRVLDAQYFGLAQRRKRVFVVGYLGDWRRAAAVLLEPQSLCGDPPTRGEAGQRAPTIPSRSSAGGGLGTDFDCDGGLVESAVAGTLAANRGGRDRPAGNANEADFCVVAPLISPALAARDYKSARPEASGACVIAFNADARGDELKGEDASVLTASQRSAIAFKVRTEGSYNGKKGGDVKGGHGGSGALVSGDREGTVASTQDQWVGVPIPIDTRQIRRGATNTKSGRGGEAITSGTPGTGIGNEGDPSYTLGADAGVPAVSAPPTMAVRRLTPRECERLQGFPDDYTLIPWKRGRGDGSCRGWIDANGVKHYEGFAADGPRYKALGNSMAVNCMRWIGERIAFVDAL